MGAGRRAQRRRSQARAARGVGQGLLGGEGLGDGDDQGLGGVQAMQGRGDLGAVDVGDEAQLDRAVQRPKRSHTRRGPRSEPPMPMCTTARNGLPVAPRRLPDRTASAKARIAARVASTSARDRLALGAELRAHRRAQGHVQGGAALGAVDRLAGEQANARALDVGGAGEGQGGVGPLSRAAWRGRGRRPAASTQAAPGGRARRRTGRRWARGAAAAASSGAQAAGQVGLIHPNGRRRGSRTLSHNGGTKAVPPAARPSGSTPTGVRRRLRAFLRLAAGPGPVADAPSGERRPHRHRLAARAAVRRRSSPGRPAGGGALEPSLGRPASSGLSRLQGAGSPNWRALDETVPTYPGLGPPTTCKCILHGISRTRAAAAAGRRPTAGGPPPRDMPTCSTTTSSERRQTPAAEIMAWKAGAGSPAQNGKAGPPAEGRSGAPDDANLAVIPPLEETGLGLAARPRPGPRCRASGAAAGLAARRPPAHRPDRAARRPGRGWPAPAMAASRLVQSAFR